MKPENCALYILAAGLSKRFGEGDKLMAKLGGEPLLSHAIKTATPVPFGAKHGIISATSIKRRSLFKKHGFDIIENPAPYSGQGSSIIHAAKHAIENNYEGICIMLGDMPFIPSSHLYALTKTLDDKESAISSCNQTIMPPMALRRSIYHSLENIDPAIGAKSLFKNRNTAYLPLSNLAGRDIDTLETLARLNAQIGE